MTDRMVQLALDNGYVTPEQVAEARRQQALLTEQGVASTLLTLLEERGDLKAGHVSELRRLVVSDHAEGLVVDGWELTGRLGRGGMGDVFLGERDGREAAVKVLPRRLASDQEYLARFQREVRALDRLDHPHITGLVSSGEIDGRPFLAMELVRGENLKERLRTRGPMPESEARVLLAQMGRALQHCWSRGIVHRDVKPSNIILAPPRSGHDEPFCAKLCDFGLAKFREDLLPRGEALTGTGVAVGTPHYMSPEQATGDRSVDARHDIYSLGATVYHALLGQTLYSGRSSAVIMYQQANADLDLAPLRANGRVHPDLVELLAAMLAKPREARIASWEQVHARLDALPPLPGTRSGQRAQLAVLAVAVLCVLLGLGWLLLGRASGLRLHVAPGDLGRQLREARAYLHEHPGGRAVLDLQAGDHPGPLVIEAPAEGLVVAASSAGVRVVSAGDGALVTVGPGAHGAVLSGLLLCGPGAAAGTGVVVEAGADLTLRGCRLDGFQTGIAAAGRLTAEGLRVSHCRRGLVLRTAAEAHLADGVLSVSGQAIAGDGAILRLERMRVRATESAGPGPLVDLRGGQAILATVSVEAFGCSHALSFNDQTWCELREVSVADAAVGIETTHLDLVRGLSVDAGSTGLIWAGPVAGAPAWERVRLRAPLPVRGLTGIPDGSGPDPAAMARLPPP